MPSYLNIRVYYYLNNCTLVGEELFKWIENAFMETNEIE